APPRITVVERACTEHRSKGDRIHPGREPLQVPVGKSDENGPGDHRGDERVEVEHASEARHVDLRHRPMMPNPRYVCGMRASSAAASASRTGSSSTRSRTSWKNP